MYRIRKYKVITLNIQTNAFLSITNYTKIKTIPKIENSFELNVKNVSHVVISLLIKLTILFFQEFLYLQFSRVLQFQFYQITSNTCDI